MRHPTKHYLTAGGIAVAMLAGQAAQAAPITPEIDFRSSQFSRYKGQSSFRYTNTVNRIDYDFTVSARRSNGGSGRLWWDARDGLGIYGNEDDEIGAGQILRIDFHNPAAMSHLFFADLFANETRRGRTYNEVGYVRINGEETRGFVAGYADYLWGDAGNGEAMLAFADLPIVDTLELFADSTYLSQDFALLGLTDPAPLMGDELESVQLEENWQAVPAPGTLAILLGGLLGLAATRRA